MDFYLVIRERSPFQSITWATYLLRMAKMIYNLQIALPNHKRRKIPNNKSKLPYFLSLFPSVTVWATIKVKFNLSNKGIPPNIWKIKEKGVTVIKEKKKKSPLMIKVVYLSKEDKSVYRNIYREKEIPWMRKKSYEMAWPLLMQFSNDSQLH